MKRDTHITEVKFFIEKTEGELPCNVFAFFPKEKYYSIYQRQLVGKDDYNNMLTCYSHIGQHSACHLDYAKECKPAKESEYSALKAELEGIGYNLQIV